MKKSSLFFRAILRAGSVYIKNVRRTLDLLASSNIMCFGSGMSCD